LASVTLAHRVRYGSVASIGRDVAIPFSKRYFLGGAESLRGWGRLEVSPLSRAGNPIGGQSLFEASSEARVRLTSGLTGVTFLDVGNVWVKPWDFRPGRLLSDAGVGVRYQSPFGLLRLDFGYQLNRLDGLLIDGRPQDRPWRVHFSVGQAF
jgi:outer membrane translocation and assembly module TamA